MSEGPKSIEQVIIEHGSKAWTVKDFATLFDLSLSGVYKMIRQERLAGIGKGSRVRICPKTVWKYYQDEVTICQSRKAS